MNLRIGEHRRTHKADFWEIARGRGGGTQSSERRHPCPYCHHLLTQWASGSERAATLGWK